MNKSGSDYAAAAAKLGYDPNLVYSSEFKDDDGNPLNVLLLLMDIRMQTVMQQSKQQSLHLSQPILFSN